MIKKKVTNITTNHIISDLVSRIKNRALSPNLQSFEVLYSKDTKFILDLLAREGYLNWTFKSTPCLDFQSIRDLDLNSTPEIDGKTKGNPNPSRGQIIVNLNVDSSGKVLLHTINIKSKPGKRIYAGWKSLLPLTKDHSALIRTSKGIYTLTQAIECKIGGEILLTYK